MGTRWRLLVGLLVAGASLFVLVYCGLFDLVLCETHTAVEAVWGETPQKKVEAYLAAVRRGDRQAALACWPANERLGAGSSLRHRVLDVEWRSGCCEPAAFNVAGNETMVWFHALRDGVWYYVEMGVYRQDL